MDREDLLDRSGADWNAAGTARVFPSRTSRGWYAIAYITTTGEEACADCLNAEGSQFHFDADNQSGWQIVGFTHSGDAASKLQCCHCNRTIAEGYGCVRRYRVRR